MMRQKNANIRLAAVISQAYASSFKWGAADCFKLSRDAYKAVTGKKLLPQIKAYQSEKGGVKQFRKAGFETLDQALSFALAEGPKLFAQQGDIGLVLNGEHHICAVYSASGWVVKTELGLAQISSDKIIKRFVV